jgi:hypothetical protein
MIAYRVIEAKQWHCGAMIHRLRDEQTNLAISLGVNAHRSLRTAYCESGIARSWISETGDILAMFGVAGPLLATEGEIWLALSKEATRYPITIIKQARRQLSQVMLFKHRLYATPSVKDPASVRFAKRLGFIELPGEDDVRKIGGVPMVFALNVEAYVERRAERVN